MADNPSTDITKRYIFSSEAHKGYGFNGVKGDRFTDVAGWEQGTAGFAGNIYSRLAAENGIQPVDPVATAAREPFKTGRFLIKLMRPCPFWDDRVTAAWRYIIEDSALEFSGINDYSFDVFTKQHGAIRQTYAYAGTYKENNGEFTIKVPETLGQLVRKSIDYWIQGCSDQKTAVAHFYGKNMRDIQANKSISILYVLMGPECRAETIEYACMYHDAIITSPKHSQNNSGTLGETGQGVDHDLSFNGVFDRSAEINKLAAIIVDREGLYEERADNAVLPSYIYKDYLSNAANEFDTIASSAKLSDRLLADLELAENGRVDAAHNHSYNDADAKSVREQFHATASAQMTSENTGDRVTREEVDTILNKNLI